MIDTSLQGRLVALVQGARDLILDLGDSPSTPPAGVRPGDTLPARVVSLLPDGRALLDLGGTRLPVRFPEGVTVAPGQQFRLAVVETEPALRLQLPAPDSPAPRAAPAAAVNLSPVAERLAAVLLARREPAGAAAAAPLLDAAPVLARPETRGEALAAPLRQALETSGLFYESHQAEWVAGRRELPALRAEPQARLAGTGTDAAAVPSPASSPGAAGAAASTAPVAAGIAAASSARAELLQGLPPAVAAVLERQIEAVASQQILWTGELWPGQRLEWRVEERTGDGPAADAADAPWRTRLRLELPGLGAVEARLELAGASLRLSVAAAGDEPSGALRTAERDLRAALEARGLDLQGFRVEEGDGG